MPGRNHSVGVAGFVDVSTSRDQKPDGTTVNASPGGEPATAPGVMRLNHASPLAEQNAVGNHAKVALAV